MVFRRFPGACLARPDGTMRILWLKSDLLLPLDKGGRLRTWDDRLRMPQFRQTVVVHFVRKQQPNERFRWNRLHFGKRRLCAGNAANVAVLVPDWGSGAA